jgi:ParB-like chromosome segregation protein Spo0J
VNVTGTGARMGESVGIVGPLRHLAVGIDTVMPLDRNPRRGNVQAIAGSLARFGQRKPIVVRESDRQIIAGNHTWRAARSLGWAEIAAILVDDDAQTSTAFALADNRTGDLGTYDSELLAALIRSVDTLDGTGFSSQEVGALLARLEKPAADPAGAPRPGACCPKCGASA